MISVKINPALVYGTGVINPGVVPQMRSAGLAGSFDPTAYVTGQLPGMGVPMTMNTPGQAVRILVTRGDNWRGRFR